MSQQSLPPFATLIFVMVNRTTVFVALLAWIFAIAAAQDDQCPGARYCGDFCCPGLRGIGDLCCQDEQSCCASENGTTPKALAFCGSNLSPCPDSLPASEVYDSNNELRDECCLYFRSGCCSRGENSTLDLLFYMTLILSILVVTIIAILAVLIACCYCCGCLSSFATCCV